MKILIVAATEGEISLLRDIQTIHEIDFLVTDPGMVATTYSLTKKLSDKKYDLAINVGLAGSFDRSIAIGEVVRVTEDIFSELGAEDGDSFLSLKEIGLNGENTFSNSTDVLETEQLRRVKGITVNMVHGNDESIKKITSRLNPQVETMEGAAFFYVCEKENVPCIQLRAISNYVTKRDRSAWNIPLALEKLSETVKKLLVD